MWRIVLIFIATALLSFGLSGGEPFAQTSGEGAGQLESLNQQAFQAFQKRDFAGAEALAQQAWEVSQANAEGVGAGLAAANRAAVLTIHGRFKEAQEWQDRAEEIIKKSGNTELQGRLEVARAVADFLRARQYSAGEPEE